MPTGPTPLPPPSSPPHDVDLQETVARLQTQLQAKITELLDAGPDRIRVLSAEIQRLRVAIGLLREIKSDSVDSALYRELSLLTKMLTEDDLDKMQKEHNETQSEERANRLQRLGLDPLQATRMARVLTTVAAAAESNGDEAKDPQHTRD